MIATARYELLMGLRRRALWITMGVVVALLGAVAYREIDRAVRDGNAEATMASAAFLVNLILPVAYGCLLADRLVRDARLGVAPVLDATPAAAPARLLGTYLGACAAVAVPVSVVYFGFASVDALVTWGPTALWWGLAMFAVVVVPALLFVGAFALVVPLVMPVPLFCVLFVGYWFWSTAVTPVLLPTLSQTVLSPLGGYPLQALFDYRGADGTLVLAGPARGAILNVLRPEVTPAAAWLSVGSLLAAAALALAAGHLLRTRATRQENR